MTRGGTTVEADLPELVHVGDVGEGVVLDDPAEGLDAALACGGDDGGEDVEAGEVGRARVFGLEQGVVVVLRMDGGEVAAAEGSGGAGVDALVHVGDGVEEERVDVGEALDVVEHTIDAVGEDAADVHLNADEGFGRGGRLGEAGAAAWGKCGGGAGECGGLHEFAAVHWVPLTTGDSLPEEGESGLWRVRA